MNEEQEIARGLRPRVTELTGNEDEADAASLAHACTLLYRYTSRAYIAEAAALFGTVVDAFESWPQATEHFGERTLHEWMPGLRKKRAAYEQGLAQLEAADASLAYASILSAVSDMEPQSPRDERHFSLGMVVQALGTPTTAVGAQLGAMSERIATTLRAGWTYQTLTSDPALMQARTLAAIPQVPTLQSGSRVTKTGIWLPTTIRYGCPNFLIAAKPAPPMTRACKRYDYAARDGGGLETPRHAWRAYDYIEEPTVWRLLWEDTRHRVRWVSALEKAWLRVTSRLIRSELNQPDLNQPDLNQPDLNQPDLNQPDWSR